jgi:hypothetical protein
MPSSTCDTCRISRRDLGRDLSLCRRCKSSWYCSADCQRIAWREHKKICKPFDEESFRQGICNLLVHPEVGLHNSVEAAHGVATSCLQDIQELKSRGFPNVPLQPGTLLAEQRVRFDRDVLPLMRLVQWHRSSDDSDSYKCLKSRPIEQLIDLLRQRRLRSDCVGFTELSNRLLVHFDLPAMPVGYVTYGFKVPHCFFNIFNGFGEACLLIEYVPGTPYAFGLTSVGLEAEEVAQLVFEPVDRFVDQMYQGIVSTMQDIVRSRQAEVQSLEDMLANLQMYLDRPDFSDLRSIRFPGMPDISTVIQNSKELITDARKALARTIAPQLLVQTLSRNLFGLFPKDFYCSRSKLQ